MLQTNSNLNETRKLYYKILSELNIFELPIRKPKFIQKIVAPYVVKKLPDGINGIKDTIKNKIDDNRKIFLLDIFFKT